MARGTSQNKASQTFNISMVFDLMVVVTIYRLSAFVNSIERLARRQADNLCFRDGKGSPAGVK
jgi:hypothetical protein